MSNSASRAALPLITLLAALAPASAFAALGGDVASVLRDSAALGARHSVTPFAGYDLHEAITDDGVLVRQYVDRSGRVFAVSWQGRRSPNVQALLGEHAAEYEAALKARRFPNHHVASIEAPGLAISVIRAGRGWMGQALVPNALPAGVQRADIR